MLRFVSTLAALSSATLTCQAGEHLVMHGRGVAFVELKSVEQADGSKAQTFYSRIVQEIIDGDRKGLTFGGDCLGSATVDPAGKYAGVLRCSYKLNDKDGYTIAIADDADVGGSFTVTGGTGAFKGATGSGKYSYVWGDAVYGDRLVWTADTIIDLK